MPLPTPPYPHPPGPEAVDPLNGEEGESREGDHLWPVRANYGSPGTRAGPAPRRILPPSFLEHSRGRACGAGEGGGSVVLEVLGENRETWWKGDEGDSLAITKGMALSSSGV